MATTEHPSAIDPDALTAAQIAALPPEILTDGATVWVNAPDGMCIGRFGRMGVDVHRDAEGQMRTGRQCLACVHDLPHAQAWARFKEAMLDHHGLEIDEALRPAYARA